MEAMYGRSRLTVKVEPRSSLNFYVYARKIYVRKYVKLPVEIHLNRLGQ